MGIFKAIFAAYALQLCVVAMMLLIVPIARFITRRIMRHEQIYQSITRAQRVELYPVVESAPFDILLTCLFIVFVFASDPPLSRIPALRTLSYAVLPVWLAATAYRLIRSCVLLRRLPADEPVLRQFVRATAIESAIGTVALLLMSALYLSVLLHATQVA